MNDPTQEPAPTVDTGSQQGTSKTPLMRAWRAHEFGKANEVLKCDNIARPQPAQGQLLVEVKAVPVNFPDSLIVAGTYQVRPELPFSPGLEMCGVVTECGPDVKPWQMGDRVIGTPVLPFGGFADYAILDARHTYRAPETLDDAEAAALLIGYQTAWFALKRRANLQAGETLLVHASAGGVGSAAVQLGKAIGARVIGVAGGSDKAELTTQLGADVVVDRRTENFIDVVKEVTGGAGADVVFDPVGGDAFDGSTRCIAFEGRIVVVGFAGGRIQAPGLNHALVKNYSILGLHWGLYASKRPDLVRECHEDLVSLAAEGLIRPLVSERLPLSNVPAAIERVASGKSVGRVVILPGA